MALVFNPFTGNFDNVMASSSDMSFSGGSLNVNGDITLDSGGDFTTTVQAVTPTANRTISFPDATGTVALVNGANGTIQYNDAGTLKGNSDFTVDVDWNDASTVFTGLKLNVTDGAGGSPVGDSDSNLLDLQSGGTSKAKIDASGDYYGALYSFFGETNRVSIRYGGTRLLTIDQTGSSPGARVGSNSAFAWSSLANSEGAPDLFLRRDAAGIFAQRNGTNAQTYRLYNTYTDASNYERLSFNWDTNVFKIKSEAAGTGTVRGIELSTTNQNIRLEEAATEIRSTISNTNFPSWSFERATGSIRGGIAINNFTYDFGTFVNYPVGIRVNNQEKIRVTNEGTLGLSVANTVSSLPSTPVVGMIARVTDGDSGLTFGQTVVNTGGGGTPYLCWYNGTNWTVIGA